MTKRNESREHAERGLKRVRRSDKAWTKDEVSRGTCEPPDWLVPTSRLTGSARDRDAQGVVPDAAKRNPEQPGPAKRVSPNDRLRYRRLATELRPWLHTLDLLSQDTPSQDVQTCASATYLGLHRLLQALDEAG